ncbi:MAG TPA: hypothetical protein VFB54_02535 [Burkholderiales bacterium]|nr:hypothetical protein [Burkholderiales bacterium]
MILTNKPDSAKLAVSIIAFDSTDEHYAGINDELMYYSGSLVKVAAVYAAHDLRAQARMHAATQSFADVATFQASLASVVNPSGAVAQLRSMGVGLMPNLSSILGGFRPSGPNKVEFMPAFRDHHLSNNAADENSVFHNAGARAIIRALGYSYINVSMMRSGFYDPTTRKGIWLAGDYSGDIKDKALRLPVSRVPVVNDDVPEGGAQAITTKQMSRMFHLIHSQTGFSHITDQTERDAANQGIHDVLTPGDRLGPSPYPPGKFFSHCGKVGIGTRGPVDKPGASVLSEGSIVQWTAPPTLVGAFNTDHSRNLSGEFVLVWQNLFDQPTAKSALGRLVTSTMENFLNQS